MVKMRRRRRSIAFFVLFALLFGVGRKHRRRGGPSRGGAAAGGHRHDRRRRARHGDRDHRLPLPVRPRHGIYRVLPDVPMAAASQVKVSSDTYDNVLPTPEGAGVRIRIGDPNHKVDGNHTYRISYPLDTLSLGDGRFGWNGVGTAWEVPIDQAELDMVAPWKWESPSCSTGWTGDFGDCTVTQPEPGHLVVSGGPLRQARGTDHLRQPRRALAAAPAPRALPAISECTLPWWRRPLTLGIIGALLALVGSAGGQASSCAVPDATGSSPAPWAAGTRQAWPSAARARRTGPASSGWTTPSSTPLRPPSSPLPAGSQPGKAGSWRRRRWPTGSASPGCSRPRWTATSTSTTPTPRRRSSDHCPMPQTTPRRCWRSASRGATRSSSGPMTRRSPSMWKSLPAKFKSWFGASGFADETAEHRARVARPFALLVGILAVADRDRRCGALLQASDAGRAAGGAGRGGHRAGARRVGSRLGAARAHARRFGRLAARRVVPPVPRRVGDPPRRGGRGARRAAPVHRMGRGARRGRPLVEDGQRRRATARDRGPALRDDRASTGLVVRLDRDDAVFVGRGGGVGGGGGGGGGGSW